MTTSTTRIDVDGLGRALERRDLDELASLYAERAELEVANPAHPPSEALRLQGRGAIIDYARAIPSDVTITLEDAVVGVDGRVVAHSVCRHSDGRIVCSAWLLEGDAEGRIVVQKGIEAWDA
jgi:ketosteroid isomerase-like protein